MHKVIVERPRRGSRGPYRGVKWEKNARLEDLPTKEGIGRRHVVWGRQKELNENLAPLERYLRKQVGRPWDAVYRDICAGLKVTSAVQLHVRQHLWDYVERYVTIDENRRVFRKPGRWLRWPDALDPGELYIHPGTGLLAVVKARRRGPSGRRPRRR
jgi:hypothetical protein